MISKNIWVSDTDINVSEGSEYLLEGYIYLYANENQGVLQNLDRLLFKPVGYSLSELDSFTSVDSTSSTLEWIKVNNSFTTKATGNINIGYYIETSEQVNILSNCDVISLKGPLDTLTEKKTIIYDSGCLYKNFHVKFLDALGGYSYWTFRTYGDKGINFGESRTIKRNIFSDFPNTFKNTKVQTDYVGVNSKDTVTLRAENLTEQQREDLEELLRSVRVYDINDPNKPKVLIVDKSSISYTQGEKLYNLTFNATSTFDNYRQRQ